MPYLEEGCKKWRGNNCALCRGTATTEHREEGEGGATTRDKADGAFGRKARVA
jgi:hypothetical protein